MASAVESSKLNMVTGAFSYTGKYITKRLLSMGEMVRTLTGHPERDYLFEKQVKAFPYSFDKPEKLLKSLSGVDVFYNTYWIRFPYGELTFDRAVANTRIIIELAKEAGVKRIVHISITNADEESSLPYFRGKGIIERLVLESGLSYAILRPTIIFGLEDILINNIAWNLRKFPVFGIFGKGDYRVQPIYVEDLAEIAIDAARQQEDIIIDAAGPEIFTFDELVHLIKDKIKSNAKILSMPLWLPLLFSKIVAVFVNDVILARDEVEGLMREFLYSKEPPRGKTKLSVWLEEYGNKLGRKYASELKRHYLSEKK